MAEDFLYDEDDAIKFIRNYLPETSIISDDDILFVIDCIWDYYEDNGLLDLSDINEEEENMDFDIITDFVKKSIKKDGNIEMSDQDLRYIIKGELDYEESLDIFDN